MSRTPAKATPPVTRESSRTGTTLHSLHVEAPCTHSVGLLLAHKRSGAHVAHAHPKDVESGEVYREPEGYKRKHSGPDLFSLAPQEEPHPRLHSGELPEADECEDINAPSTDMTPVMEAWTRGKWLLALLVLQSTSSMVLESYEVLLREHLVITLFLTMLVGAGGNAGNQSAIKVIRGMATGSIKTSMPYFQRLVGQQAMVGLLLGTGLSVGGFVRVYLTNGNIVNSIAISSSLFVIVMTSVLAGTALPFVLSKAGIDPANAGTTIQVVMDIMGVLITCITCKFIFDQLVVGLGV